MTTKIVTIFKYITIISILIFSIVSCETDYENVGGELVDNGVFDTNRETFELLSYTKNLDKSRVDNISTAVLTSLKTPLGVMNNEDFGFFKSDVIAQLIPPSGLEWGEAPKLDAVYLEIPYDATSIRETEDTTPKFELNNIYGNKDVEYQIKISRLETYLNRLDPYDPSKPNSYYSDKVYDKSTVLYQEEFKPNANDTVLYVERTLLSDSYNFEEIQVNDTIKLTDDKPFIRFKLDKTFFQDNFMNQDASYFENRDEFLNQFKGIVIEANSTTDEGSVMMLDFSLAKVNLYYTNLDEKIADEKEPVDLNNDGDYLDEGESEGIDLNNDGDYTDTGVTIPFRDKKILSFPLIGIKSNHIERTYLNASGFTQITSPNMVEGEQKLYVQGGAGSVAVIDLFNGVDLDELRAKNWLINEANLTFNIDNQNDNDVPSRLLLYKLDTDETNDINENAQILDAITEPDYFNGFLQIDDEETENPTKYKVNITDYISEVLRKEDFIMPSKLGLKVYNGLDKPITVNDTIVKDYSWNPQGVVLYGNNFSEADADFAKRLKLEIYYTELKN
jgi:hypothetical protein